MKEEFNNVDYERFLDAIRQVKPKAVKDALRSGAVRIEDMGTMGVEVALDTVKDIEVNNDKDEALRKKAVGVTIYLLKEGAAGRGMVYDYVYNSDHGSENTEHLKPFRNFFDDMFAEAESAAAERDLRATTAEPEMAEESYKVPTIDKPPRRMRDERDDDYTPEVK